MRLSNLICMSAILTSQLAFAHSLTLLEDRSIQDHDFASVPFGSTRVDTIELDTGFEIYDAYSKGFIEEITIPREWDATMWRYCRSTNVISAGENSARYWGTQGSRIAKVVNGKTVWRIDHLYGNQNDECSSLTMGVLEVNPKRVIASFESTGSVPTDIIDAETGHIVGNLPEASTLDMDQSLFFARHLSTVAAYDRKTLNKVWETKIGFSNVSQTNLVITEDYVFSTNKNGMTHDLYLLDKKTGELLTKMQLDTQIVWGLSTNTERRRPPNTVKVRLSGDCSSSYCVNHRTYIIGAKR